MENRRPTNWEVLNLWEKICITYIEARIKFTRTKYKALELEVKAYKIYEKALVRYEERGG